MTTRSTQTRTRLRRTNKTKPSGLTAYEREVRRELEKKIGKAMVPTDIYSDAYMQIVKRSYRSEVHPLAAAGVITIAAGLAPEKAPAGGLCCGQK